MCLQDQVLWQVTLIQETGDRFHDPTDVDSNEACVVPSAVDVPSSFANIPHPTSSEDISVVNPGAVPVTGTPVTRTCCLAGIVWTFWWMDWKSSVGRRKETT